MSEQNDLTERADALLKDKAELGRIGLLAVQQALRGEEEREAHDIAGEALGQLITDLSSALARLKAEKEQLEATIETLVDPAFAAGIEDLRAGRIVPLPMPKAAESSLTSLSAQLETVEQEMRAVTLTDGRKLLDKWADTLASLRSQITDQPQPREVPTP
jgi:prefoldin subunit 5